jgi:hypothetical protein
MKTSTFFAALCLGLVCLFSATVFAGGIATKGNGAANASIRYAVNVQYSGPDKPLNVVYMVQILNENYKLVAPAQMLLPGKTQYSFFEKGPADGIRIAVIVKAALGMGASEPFVTLVADPCAVKGPFEVGKTYRFDLFPKLQGAKE